MMQYLKKGKALCSAVFPNFVDSFNAIVDFVSNLKGDDDVMKGTGKITLDRSDEGHPIIRCTGCNSSGESGVSAGLIVQTRDTADQVTSTIQIGNNDNAPKLIFRPDEFSNLIFTASNPTTNSGAIDPNAILITVGVRWK